MPVLGLGLPAASARPPEFTGVGALPGYQHSRMLGLSANGTTAVGTVRNTGSDPVPVRWTAAGGLHALNPGGGLSWPGVALDCSGNGTAAVGWATDAAGHTIAFRWTLGDERTQTGTMESLGDLPGGATESIATACSVGAYFVVGSSGSDSKGPASQDAFLVAGSGPPQALGDLKGGAHRSAATGISPDGFYVVGVGDVSLDDRVFEAFIWRADRGLHGLGDFPGGSGGSRANDVSDDGFIVVGSGDTDEGRFAFCWADPERGGPGLVNIGDLPGGQVWAEALACSADGAVIVGMSDGDDGLEAFIWDMMEGMRTVRAELKTAGVEPPGWVLRSVTAISADGRTLAGEGINPAGDEEGWVAHLGPAPIPGDVNCDGRVNFDDITPFVVALVGPEAYALSYPDCRWLNGDTTGDRDVNFDDIDAFIFLLIH